MNLQCFSLDAQSRERDRMRFRNRIDFQTTKESLFCWGSFVQRRSELNLNRALRLIRLEFNVLYYVFCSRIRRINSGELTYINNIRTFISLIKFRSLKLQKICKKFEQISKILLRILKVIKKILKVLENLINLLISIFTASAGWGLGAVTHPLQIFQVSWWERSSCSLTPGDAPD